MLSTVVELYSYLAKLLRLTSDPPRTHWGVEVPLGAGRAQLNGIETRSKCNSELL